MNRTIAIILGGGKGTRLFPLTKERAKPAVPFAGKYRLIDIPMSNCINSGVKQIYVLTQFNSASLHNHIASTYMFDSFTDGFVEILAAEQTFENRGWFEGTADAVRKNFQHFYTHEPSYYIVLSGDQLYRLDLRRVLERHIDSGADITVAVTPVDRARAADFGIVRINNSNRATDFVEKPGMHSDVTEWAWRRDATDTTARADLYLASMGMYVFSAPALRRSLDNDGSDFGAHIIPRAIGTFDVGTFVFDEFWVDIGTIRSYYETHIDLASQSPSFNFYDERMPIYTHRKHLPPTKVIDCDIKDSLAAEGSIIDGATIRKSCIGRRTRIESGTDLDGVVVLGSDIYETPEQLQANEQEGIPNVGIGNDSTIRRTIIDSNARIGSHCRIGETTPRDGAYDGYHVRDGIIIIPKGSIIENGTRI